MKALEETTSSAGPLYGAIGSESTYCSSVSTPSPATTITATAQFYARQVSSTLGLIGPGAAKPIRYGEVQVLNSSGTIIQCGETDAAGAVSIDIPKTAGSYTLKILSRANGTKVKASVLKNPTSMEPYSISVAFTTAAGDTSKAVTLPIASYTGTLEGGAFNILDQIYLANEYIRNNSTCAGFGGICTAFTVAPKVQIFWTPGLSPGAYYNSPTSSISFYTPTNNSSLGMATGMYIMGGIQGSVCVDTDHFDNSIIIHEYGHFLEKTYAYSDSPGGSHNGNGIIDPRLAWSEGWANFLQGAVRGEAKYVDTHGNLSCTDGTGVSINLDLENITAGQDAVSGATFVGEGVFREVSVSRTLWDMVESNAGGDTKGANLGFAPLWYTFSNSSVGFASTSIHFRNIGHFNEILRGLVSTNAAGSVANYDAVISNEAQRSDRQEYARIVAAKASGACAVASISLAGVSGVNNLAKTNDFLAYYYDGTAAHSLVKLKYTTGGASVDLDLYVFKEAYSFSDSSTLMGSSARFYPEVSGTGEESVSLSGKSAGYYLIQVAADPDSGNGTDTYHLETTNGDYICP